MEFLKKNKRFSLKLDYETIWDLDYQSETKEENNSIITTYFFKNGLKLINAAKNMKNMAHTNG